jgi:hypothetical protein
VWHDGGMHICERGVFLVSAISAISAVSMTTGNKSILD